MTPETAVALPPDAEWRYLQWTPIVAEALAATALSLILVTFATAVGLGVSSTAPTWWDTSVALWILSGIFLILQAVLSFGFGGYLAGRMRRPGIAGSPEPADTSDGLHGLTVWALAVVLGATLAAWVGASALNRNAPRSTTVSSAEPLLSYELDRLYRSPRRAPNADLSSERAEAGRILLTSSSHSGLNSDDRSFLIQQVAAATGLSPADAERRVDNVVANSKTAIQRTRHSTIILAFSIATALLLGAIAAWAAACAGGRHRDGAALPGWMTRSNEF